jgi:predicted DNA-binding transcriptional regulator AlpA
MPKSTPPRQSKSKNPQLLPTEFWDIRQVSAKTNLSKTAVYRLMPDGNFPLPIRIGNRKRSVVWIDTEVLGWMRQQAESAERVGPGHAAVPNVPWSRARAASGTPKAGQK